MKGHGVNVVTFVLPDSYISDTVHWDSNFSTLFQTSVQRQLNHLKKLSFYVHMHCFGRHLIVIYDADIARKQLFQFQIQI
jgi:hypothetical protein